jgi:general secretion pathway protein G
MKISPRNGTSGFTLIEILTVIAIIGILAGLIVGLKNYAADKQDRDLATVQVALIAKTLEEYKLDNGAYPPTENSTTGEKSSKILFNALYWDSDDDKIGVGTGSEEGDKDQKIYMPELDPAASKQKWTKTPASETSTILDPWGREYRYRSAKDATGKDNQATENPDYDLWSVGKDGATKPEVPTSKENLDDITAN